MESGWKQENKQQMQQKNWFTQNIIYSRFKYNIIKRKNPQMYIWGFLLI